MASPASPSSSPSLPPSPPPTPQNSRLICHVVDELAKYSPNQLFCVQPVSADIFSRGWREVTFKELAGAVDYMAWWIERVVGPACTQEAGVRARTGPLAYMGANDIRYVVFILACMKSGHVTLLPSPRNSERAFLHVLEKTACSRFVYSPERRNQVLDLQQKVEGGIEVWEIPGLWEMFDHPAEAYRCEKRYADVEDEPSVVIHSSGTTGFPKLVYLTHGFWSVMDNMPSFPTPPGRRCGAWIDPSVGGNVKPLFTMAPFFHLMGLYVPIKSILLNIPFVLSPEKPMSVDLLARIVDDTGPEMGMLAPSLIEELASTEKGLETVKRFKTIFFGGAPLSKEVGDRLCREITLQTAMGSSEAGLLANLLIGDREDWEYIEWNPAYGIDMQMIMGGVHEMVLCRGENRHYHGIFHTYPDIQEYRTRDLFVRHPTKPDLWRYHGRLDDVIVLSNGEKFNPIEMEKILEGHPLVSRALVVGQARFQSALLVEPNWQLWDESITSERSFINQLWPTVRKANEIAPSHGRVMKTKIGVASRRKPFKLTPKGSVQRKPVVSDYAEEIDAIYARSEEEEYLGKIPQEAALEGITNYIQSVVSDLLLVDQVQETSDIFALGLDSLQTLQLSKILQGAVRSLRRESDFQAITSQKLYSYPSVKQLSSYIYSLVHDRGSDAERGTDDEPERVAKIAALIEKYTGDLPETQVTKFNRSERHAVVLTGSTGSLGNYILSELLKDTTISKIYCLNRAADAETKQIASFKEKGLEIPPDFHARVEFMTAKFSADKFGLSDQTYEKLKTSVDTIIHNAWKVNFNHQVEAFEDTHIAGIRRLVDFSTESPHKPHIHFISSIATIGAWTSKHGSSVPEIPLLEDLDVVMRQGYGESKHVAERICVAASARSGVPTSIYRVGQIGGPTTERGVWNRQEWLPSVLATSKTIGKVPTGLGSLPVDWIPVDSLAKIIIEITRSRQTTELTHRSAAFHLINPSTASWEESLLPAILKSIPTADPVDLASWVEALEVFSTNLTESDLQDKPALKIMEFFRGLLMGEQGNGFLGPPTETTRAQGASRAMRELGPIDGGLMGNWMRQWGF